MKKYDVKCPICGTVNHDLYLEETNGWMECEHCHETSKTLGTQRQHTQPSSNRRCSTWYKRN